MKKRISVFDRLSKFILRKVKRIAEYLDALTAKASTRSAKPMYTSLVTERLDAVYGSDPESSRIDPLIMRLRIESLPKEDW